MTIDHDVRMEIALEGIRANCIAMAAGVPMVGIKSEADLLANVVALAEWGLEETAEAKVKP